MWGVASGWSLGFCLVFGAVMGFVYGYVTDPGPDKFFWTEGRFVADNGMFTAVLGVGLALIVSFPAGVLAAAIFALVVSRRDVESLPTMPRLRWWAVAIAASVQFVAYLWLSWSTEVFDSPKLGEALSVMVAAPVLASAAVAAWLGPHLVRSEIARQSGVSSLPSSG